jgi:hypothetical protein
LKEGLIYTRDRGRLIIPRKINAIIQSNPEEFLASIWPEDLGAVLSIDELYG